jgi:phage repressor protein C with HTH and peptisase S24 domain
VLESCEGDEYVITITFLDEESTVEEAPVDIVLEQINEDGSTDELRLEGDLSDARALASTLEAEGSCVEVEIAQPDEEESLEEAAGASGEAPEGHGVSEEVPESGEEVNAPAELPVPSSP